MKKMFLKKPDFETVSSERMKQRFLSERMKQRFLSGGPVSFLNDEEGIGTVELVLILVVLIGLVVIFRDSISSLLKTLFAKINGEAIGL